MRFSFFSLALLVVTASLQVPNVFADYRKWCFESTAPDRENWGYCVYEDPASPNADILYALPQLGQTHSALIQDRDYRAIRTEWARQGLPAPRMISFMPFPKDPDIWLLTPGTGIGRAELDYVIGTLIPTAERKLSVRAKPVRRVILGSSMGGFNALVLFKALPSFFARIALACPLMPPFAPSDQASWDAFLAANKSVWDPMTGKTSGGVVDESTILDLMSTAKHFFPNPADWNLVDPLAANLGSTPTYISSNVRDELGFQFGVRSFLAARSSAVQSGQITVESLPGSHCQAFGTAKLARFLILP